MPRYVAFLRAINVGRHIVKMERLRALFGEMGFAKVETFIASGNVLFETGSKSESALQNKIEKHLREALGYEVGTFLRSEQELARIAEHPAFSLKETGAEGATVYVAFLSEAPNKIAANALTSHVGVADKFNVNGNEIYWLCRTRFSDSEFSGNKFEKLLGKSVTVRNFNTVRQLISRLSVSSG